MKAVLILLAFCCFNASAMAQESANKLGAPDQHPVLEQYNYSMRLDIAKVVSVDEVPSVCGVVPQRMTYIDSEGARQVLSYLVMGDGCSNG
jgi:hypothetical protein